MQKQISHSLASALALATSWLRRVSCTRQAGDWLFSLKDNGIGIAPQYAERVFVIFQRLHTSEVYKGTGIGLAVCKKIVERHGGRIWVDSESGTGAFYSRFQLEPIGQFNRRFVECSGLNGG